MNNWSLTSDKKRPFLSAKVWVVIDIEPRVISARYEPHYKSTTGELMGEWVSTDDKYNKHSFIKDVTHWMLQLPPEPPLPSNINNE